MVKVVVVTTFSPAGYRCYGKQFVETFAKHTDTPLVVYHESQDDVVMAPNVNWRNLDADLDRKAFLAKWGSDPDKIGTEADFNSQSIRFCHKVFAITDAAKWSQAEWLVWMDSDVTVFGAPDWNDLLPDGKSVVYLGRDPALNPAWIFGAKWRPICSETGFVGYRLADSGVRAALEDMRRFYTSDAIFDLHKTDWHDAKIFDLCREKCIDKDRWHNLCEGKAGTHVWPLTKLGKWSRHNKGPGRKMGVYGAIAP